MAKRPRQLGGSPTRHANRSVGSGSLRQRLRSNVEAGCHKWWLQHQAGARAVQHGRAACDVRCTSSAAQQAAWQHVHAMG